MSSYFYRPNKDAGAAFVQALDQAGYQRTDNINRADFLLLDHDDNRYQPEYTDAIRSKPLFVYPHVPYGYFLWDGILKPKPVTCNFVASDGAKEAMQLYGYPYRVESVGMPGASVREFQPTTGTKVLFAPAHPLSDGQYPTEYGYKRTQAAANWLVQQLGQFESVTVRWHGKSLQSAGLYALAGLRNVNMKLQAVDVYATPNIRESALQAIAHADIVISQSTFGCLSVAMGKPTVFYGHSDGVLDCREGNAMHAELYKHIWQYPLRLEEMNLKQFLAVREAESPAVTQWKRNNIGGSFNAEKFINVIQEYIR